MASFYEHSHLSKRTFSCRGEGHCDPNIEKGVFVATTN